MKSLGFTSSRSSDHPQDAVSSAALSFADKKIGTFFARVDSKLRTPSAKNSLILVNLTARTLYLEPAFADLNRNGIATPPEVVKHIAPLGWQHISLTGDYIWTPTENLDLRPLRRETSILAA